MRTFHHTCGACGTWMDTPLTDASARAACPHCGAEVRAEVFPALFRPAAPGARGEDVLTGEESTCFYHPSKKAVAACESCGRFLCSLCDVDFGGKHLCPRCIEAGANKGKMETLKNEMTHYDDVALVLALLGMILFFIYLSFLTAPVAIYLSLRYWNTPQSVLPRSRWRFPAALLLAAASLAATIIEIANF
jgi:uncharacterized paraquat-inducible protein A